MSAEGDSKVSHLFQGRTCIKTRERKQLGWREGAASASVGRTTDPAGKQRGWGRGQLGMGRGRLGEGTAS